MPQENVEMVRGPLRLRELSSRTLDQRLALRLPRLADNLRRLFGLLPSGSRLRQALIRRGVRLGYEAFNRRDMEAVLLGYHREVQLLPPRDLVDSGVAEAIYRGHEGYRRYFGEWLGGWGAYRSDLHELIVFGDRLLALGQLTGQGEGSGVSVTQEYASLMTLSEAQVVRQDEFFDHAEALEAVGLSEYAAGASN